VDTQGNPLGKLTRSICRPVLAGILGRDSSLVAGASKAPLKVDITEALRRIPNAAAPGGSPADAEALLQQRVKALQVSGASVINAGDEYVINARTPQKCKSPLYVSLQIHSKTVIQPQCRGCMYMHPQGAMEESTSEDSRLLQLAKAATSPLVNELLSPGARIAERLTQLGEIQNDIYPL
jgi:hypothetical protein